MRTSISWLSSLVLLVPALACNNGGPSGDTSTSTTFGTLTGDGDGETGSSSMTGDGDPGDGDGESGDGDGDPGDGDGDTIKFDMAPLPDSSDTGGGPGELCKVVD